MGQVEREVFFSYVAWVLPGRHERCAPSLPVPPHWLQRGVPGHRATTNTAQRSQATSQIAGLPHLIHCSNYTVSCHYSCYLDLSSWSSREGWGRGELVPWVSWRQKGEEEGLQHPGILRLGWKWSYSEAAGGETAVAGACTSLQMGAGFTNPLYPSACVYEGVIFWFFFSHSVFSQCENWFSKAKRSCLMMMDNQHHTNNSILSHILFSCIASPCIAFLPALRGQTRTVKG